MANEERLSAAPRTCRLSATDAAQTLILSSFAIRIILQSTSCFAARSGGSALRLGPSPPGDKSGAEANADRPSRKAQVAHSRLRAAQVNLTAASPRRLGTTVAHSRLRNAQVILSSCLNQPCTSSVNEPTDLPSFGLVSGITTSFVSPAAGRSS